MHDGTKDKILRLLVTWQLIKWNKTGMLLCVWVLHRTIFPALVNLLFHPANVAGLWAEVLPCVKVYPHACRRTLPFRRIFPRRLAVITKCLAVRTVDFMTNTSNFVEFHHQYLVPIGAAASRARLLISATKSSTDAKRAFVEPLARASTLSTAIEKLESNPWARTAFA